MKKNQFCSSFLNLFQPYKMTFFRWIKFIYAFKYNIDRFPWIIYMYIHIYVYVHVLAATPYKALTIRPPASHHKNYPSLTNQAGRTLLEKQRRAHK